SAFDQRGTAGMTKSLLDGACELLSIGGADSETIPVRSIEDLDDAGIVPILDVVVRSVVDFHLDGVTAVVDEEDDHRELEPDHLAHLLCGQLKRSISHHQNDS